MFCSIRWAGTAQGAVPFNVCASTALLIFTSISLEQERKSLRPPISESSELSTFLQGCRRAFSLSPVIFFIADARCPFGWDTCQQQKARQHFWVCLRAVAQAAPEQRKEIGSPSNSDSFPEGCVSTQALVSRGPSRWEAVFSETPLIWDWIR